MIHYGYFYRLQIGFCVYDFCSKIWKKYFSLFHGPNGFQFASDRNTEYSDVKHIGTGMLCSDLRILGEL